LVLKLFFKKIIEKEKIAKNENMDKLPKTE
jgi:hypothetical protein